VSVDESTAVDSSFLGCINSSFYAGLSNEHCVRFSRFNDENTYERKKGKFSLLNLQFARVSSVTYS